MLNRTFPKILLVFVLVFVVVHSVLGDEPETRFNDHLQIVKKLIEGDYSKRGADVCLGCHDDEEPFPTSALFETVHGHPEITGSPFQQSETAQLPHGLQCEACHGPAGEHIQKFLDEGEDREPMLNFGTQANVKTDLQNQVCLACHENYNRAHWQNSAHELAELSCTDCHEIHNRVDGVRTREKHNDMCISCHREVGADLLKRSSHPMRENTLICLDCHDPHGALLSAESLVRQPSTNEVCFECHQEKAGPFVWEHPPVVENCNICHLPHGSNQQALLVQKVPQLCQTCHSSAGHRSLRMDPERKPSDRNAEFQFLSGCLNCHAEIHGSDHPSGSLFRR